MGNFLSSIKQFFESINITRSCLSDCCISINNNIVVEESHHHTPAEINEIVEIVEKVITSKEQNNIHQSS